MLQTRLTFDEYLENDCPGIRHHSQVRPLNHLAHFALAGHRILVLLVGGFLGDYIKGRLENRFTPDIERGIQASSGDRSVHRYTPTVVKSKLRTI